MRRNGLAFCAFFLLTSPVLLAQASFSRVDQWVAEGRFADAAADLEEIAVEGGQAPNEKILRRVIETARASLERGGLKGENRSAARHVLCLSRAWFPDEELKGSDQPLRIDGGVSRPEIIGRVDPKYTEIARRARVTGIVVTEVIVDWEGCVRHPRILKGLPMGLDKAALEAVRNWTFEPATLDGEPVPVFYVLTVNFTLGEEEAGVGGVKFRREGEERPTITNRPPGEHLHQEETCPIRASKKTASARSKCRPGRTTAPRRSGRAAIFPSPGSPCPSGSWRRSR